MYDVLVGGRSLSLQLLPENPENQRLEDVFPLEIIPLKRGRVFFFFFFGVYHLEKEPVCLFED